MRDPNRIHDICVMLENLWHKVPDWRLGQLVCNLGRQVGAFDPFFVEDDVMKKAIQEYMEEMDNGRF